MLALVAWGWALADAARSRRWEWVGGLVLIAVVLSILADGHVPGGKLVLLPTQVSVPPAPWLMWSIPFVVAALSYGLWAGPSGLPSPPKAAGHPVRRAFQVGFLPALAPEALIVLAVGLLVWDVMAAPTHLIVTEFPLPSASTAPFTIRIGPILARGWADFTPVQRRWASARLAHLYRRRAGRQSLVR
ncbi:MAG: hypothetical protein ACLQUY_05320 [Ktedonobacterales bacterium]